MSLFNQNNFKKNAILSALFTPIVFTPTALADNKHTVPSYQEKNKTDYAAGTHTTTHTVVHGDTVGSIAERYGVTQESLRKWNNIHGNAISLGQVLRIAPDNTTSKAGSGHTASKPPAGKRTFPVRGGSTTQQNDVAKGNQLQEITVKASISQTSSNSKIIKDTEQLNKQQVSGIRDLIRYDGGISVLEQNRGGSSGFTMRGVDKNRVAINVDDIPQAQFFLDPTNYIHNPDQGSGARNEVELENIAAVKISKGGNSAQAGNGALGGSVGFTTKNISDILAEDEKATVTSKTSYSSKNNQFMQSTAAAFSKDNLKGFVQYTYRNGEETKIHSKAMQHKHTFQRMGAFVEKYKLFTNMVDETIDYKKPWRLFRKCRKCTETFYPSEFTKFYDLETAIRTFKEDHTDPNRKFSPAEMEQLKAMIHPYETVSAKDYTGIDRIAPNPLKYKSYSYLARFEFTPTDNQSVGVILEHTRQRYATRDMLTPGYYYPSPRQPGFKKPSVPDHPPLRPGEPVPPGPNIPPPQTDARVNGILIYYKTDSSGKNIVDAHGSNIFDSAKFDVARKEWLAKMRALINYRNNVYPKLKKEYDKKMVEYDAEKQKVDEQNKIFKQPAVQSKWAAWQEYYKKLTLYKRDYLQLSSTTNPSSGGQYFDNIMMGPYAPAVYTKTSFSDELHEKQRAGINYVINTDSLLADRIEFNLDWQKIRIDSDYRNLSCSIYPTADKNCRASKDKPGSSEELINIGYIESYKRLGFKQNKAFELGGFSHNIAIAGGVTSHSAEQKKWEFDKRFGGLPGGFINPGDKIRIPYIGGRHARTGLPHEINPVLCSRNLFIVCNFKINGHSFYASLHDSINIDKYLSIDAGVRYDQDSFKGNQYFLTRRVHKNTTFNLNTTVKPTENFNFGYRISSGFKNPSFSDMFGDNAVLTSSNSGLTTVHLKPETSVNHEFSARLTGNWGYVEVSRFINRYKGLISVAFDLDEPLRRYNMYNFSNADIEGVNVQGWLDLNAIVPAIPLGFSADIGYSYSKAIKAKRTNDRLEGGWLYSFDAIQPKRYTVGLNFDNPENKWGGSLIMTHSREKNPKELLSIEYTRENVYYGRNQFRKSNTTDLQPKPWTTFDLLGHYKVKDNITFNIGIYNLFNRQYSTWEAVRRSATTSPHRETSNFRKSERKLTEAQLSIARYSAPGRNFFASLNMKF